MPASTPENAILKAKDPSIEDNNDWPDFQLTDVDITNSRTGELSSLLVANEGNALVVTGKLAKSKPRINYCEYCMCSLLLRITMRHSYLQQC